MKLYCLSGHPNKPCNVVTFKSCTLMLDCGMDMSSVSHFLPLPLVASQRLGVLSTWVPRDADSQLEGELRECMNRIFVDSPPEFVPPTSGLVDFSEVDAILVSNYHSMLALPFITNGTGFKGVVIMTEPTMQIGRLFMEELVEYIERTPKARHASRWKHYLRSLPAPLGEAKAPNTWHPAYSMKSINSALTHVQILAYNENIDICGALKVTAVSSGFCLGSCNWLICSDHEKIAYLSGSSTLTTHPRPIDQNSLKNADVLIMTALNHTPMFNPDSMLGEFCVAVAQTVRNGGNALVPCYPSGVVYDLFECLSNHLDNIGLSLIPMYFVSPKAENSLAYSNIFSEWLSSSKQGKVYSLDDPFPHAYLTRHGRLKPFKCLHAEGFSSEYRQPCIVFCGHPSLRFGDAVHFIDMWGNNSQNAILFTEPEFDFVEALAPYQPLVMRPVYCPIDTSLDFTQARKLINELKPGKIVVPDVYLHPPSNAPHRTDLMLNLDETPLTYSECQVLSLGIHRRLETMSLSADLALSLNPSTIRPGLNTATITAALHIQDNKYVLKPLEDSDEEGSNKLPRCYPYGNLNVDDLVQRLAQAGLTDARVEELTGVYIITLANADVIIKISDASTHIISSNGQLREKLRDILLECLGSF
ncbi:integrator complex subunit 9 isoform X1 [Procambarus clarkii]|uniref:integrator complex subunit 9 isoform X1 n=2 Tax=Procambarus clarkii TaxID=6728 RepID=UPI001E67667F|nr:integrator complex subunit 9-like [Procambarus clarkii]